MALVIKLNYEIGCILICSEKNTMNKMLIIFLISLTSLLFYLQILSRFYPLEINEPHVQIYHNETHDLAIVKFVDHPPWCHSRFFHADYINKTIVLHEYYVPFRFGSKPIHQHTELVLKNPGNGSYRVYSENSYLGTIIFFNNTISWNPRDVETK